MTDDAATAEPGSEAAARAAALDAAMRLAAEQGWRAVSMRSVAEAAGLRLDQLYAAVPTRMHLLAELGRLGDLGMLAEPVDDEEPLHDRLMELVMRRLDALSDHRAGVAAVLEALPRDPAAALTLAPQIGRSLLWTLDAAGVPGATRPTVLPQVAALGIVFLSTLRVWVADDSPDQAATLAHLDKRLSRALEIANSLTPRPRRRRDDSAAASGESESATDDARESDA